MIMVSSFVPLIECFPRAELPSACRIFAYIWLEASNESITRRVTSEILAKAVRVRADHHSLILENITILWIVEKRRDWEGG